MQLTLLISTNTFPEKTLNVIICLINYHLICHLLFETNVCKENETVFVQIRKRLSLIEWKYFCLYAKIWNTKANTPEAVWSHENWTERFLSHRSRISFWSQFTPCHIITLRFVWCLRLSTSKMCCKSDKKVARVGIKFINELKFRRPFAILPFSAHSMNCQNKSVHQQAPFYYFDDFKCLQFNFCAPLFSQNDFPFILRSIYHKKVEVFLSLGFFCGHRRLNADSMEFSNSKTEHFTSF